MLTTNKIFGLAYKQLKNERRLEDPNIDVLFLLRAWEILKYFDRVKRNTKARNAGMKIK